MKIAFFLPSLAGGGAEKMIINLLQGLKGYPCELELIVASAEGVWFSVLPEDIHCVDLKTGRVIRTIPALTKYLKESRPDILFSGIDHANIVAIIAGKLSKTGVKNIISIQRMSTEIRKVHQNRREKIVDWLKPFIYSKADHIVCVSDGICKEMTQTYHLPKEKLQRIYNPIIFEKDVNKEIDTRSKKTGEKKNIVAAGRLEEVKDYSTLISAINIVHKSLDCQLIIYGEGPQREVLEEKISKFGLEDTVLLPGFAIDLQTKLQLADLFVVSSITEGFGNVIVEAMAAGVPVVSTDCPCGPREILADGKYGALVPVGDEKAVAEAIIHALQQEVDQTVLISRSKEFTIEKISKKYFNLFLNIMGEG